MPIARTHSLSRLPAQMSTRRGILLTPAMRVAQARGPVVQRITATVGPQGVANCYPGYCFDSQGQICCVKKGDSHLCISECFAYEKPKRRSHLPAWVGSQTIRARGPRML